MNLNCAEKKMTLSIKALEPKPENLERKAKKAEDGEPKEKTKKAKVAKPVEEVTEWSESVDGGVSIADLLNQK